MIRKASLALTLALTLIAAPAAAQIQPTSDLLVPYFEVGLQPDGVTTLFAVGNALDKPVDLVATVETNWGISVLKVPLTLKPKEVRTVNLRDWLSGSIPGVTLSALELSHLEATLDGHPSPKDGLYYSTEIKPGFAVGAVTLRTLGDRPNALWGDWFVVDATGNLARGDVLVNIDLSTGPSGLCDRHLLRYLEGGGFDGGTGVIVWRDVSLTPSATALAPARLQTDAASFSEAGQPLDLRSLALLPVDKIYIGTLGLTAPFGSIDLLTDGEAFVGVEHTAEGRYSVGLQAWCLEHDSPGGPGGPQVGPGLRIKTLTNGEDANLPPGPSISPGSTVTWEYVVRNIGGTPVIDIVVSDDQGVSVTCPIDSLAPGQSMTCIASGSAGSCQYANVGSVTGRSPEGSPAGDSDPSHYVEDEGAELTVGFTVGVAWEVVAPVGTPIDWILTVKNPGLVHLSQIQVTTEGIPALSCPRSDLNPEESMICVLRQTAIEGRHSAIAHVEGHGACSTVTAEATASYTGERTGPAVAIMTLTNGEDANLPPGPHILHGNAVIWTYVVTNTGSEVLSSIAVVDDQGATVDCPRDTLMLNETMTCMGDGDAVLGQYSNIGAVSGVSPQGQVVTATDPSHYFGASPLGEGCPAPFWADNPDAWAPTGFTTFQTVASVLSQASSYPPLGAATLIESLSFPDGAGLDGAASELLRTATAALLNAAHPGIDFPLTPAEVIADVNSALASSDRGTMLSLASGLDADNNLGCPGARRN